MKLRKKAFASFVCSIALAGNSLGVIAQDKAQTQTQTQTQSGKVIVKTSDGQTKEFTVDGNGPVVIDQNGQQVRINRVAQEGGQQISVTATPNGGATFFSQGGAVTATQGQDFVFVRGQAGGEPVATYSFISSEMSFDSKQVKGAPFSADVENETVQTLGDGNRIVRKTGGAIYRDSEGRTRRENTINAIGPLAGVDAARTITINNPVEGTIYSLEPQSRTARKIGFARTPMIAARAVAGTMVAGAEASSSKRISLSNGVLQGNAIKKVQPAYPAIAKAAKASGAVQVEITISEEGKVINASVSNGHPLLRDAALEAARQWEFKPIMVSGAAVKAQGTLTFNFTLGGDDNKAANQDGDQLLPKMRMRQYPSNEESLGKQVIEGVEAEGKRSTMTIPAGAIGNERAIEIVSESWYSPELQTVILSKRNDPQTGETTFRLTNIRRGDPDASLFQVPADYTVKEGPSVGSWTTSGSSTFNVRTPKPDNQ